MSREASCTQYVPQLKEHYMEKNEAPLSCVKPSLKSNMGSLRCTVHQHGTDHSCQGCTLQHLRPHTTHTHTELFHHHSPQHCPQAEKHEKMWTFFVLILLEIRNSAIIAGIQRLFQGNFKHFMVLLVLFFQRQKFRWCLYFCFFPCQPFSQIIMWM